MALPPLSFLFAAGSSLVTAVTPLAVQFLAKKARVFAIWWHYPLTVIPFIYGPAALGLRRLSRVNTPRRRLFIRAGAAAAVAFPVFLIGCLAGRYYKPALAAAVPGPHERALAGALRLVPEDIPVCTDDALAPHLAHRRYCYLYNRLPAAGPAVAPAALLLDRRAHTPGELSAIFGRARRWRLGLAAFGRDFAFFSPGPDRYTPEQLFAAWFDTVEEWECAPAAKRFVRRGELVTDPRARDGRAIVIDKYLVYKAKPAMVYPPGKYLFSFRLRAATPGDFGHVVLAARAMSADDAMAAAARADYDLSADGEYHNYDLAVASERPFRLCAEVFTVAPVLLDGIGITSSDFAYRYYAAAEAE